MDKYENAITLLSEMLLSKNNQLYLKDMEIKDLKRQIEKFESEFINVSNS